MQRIRLNLLKTSKIPHVACNPIGQAEELNHAGVDFAIVMGSCPKGK